MLWLPYCVDKPNHFPYYLLLCQIMSLSIKCSFFYDQYDHIIYAFFVNKYVIENIFSCWLCCSLLRYLQWILSKCHRADSFQKWPLSQYGNKLWTILKVNIGETFFYSSISSQYCVVWKNIGKNILTDIFYQLLPATSHALFQDRSSLCH